MISCFYCSITSTCIISIYFVSDYKGERRQLSVFARLFQEKKQKEANGSTTRRIVRTKSRAGLERVEHTPMEQAGELGTFSYFYHIFYCQQPSSLVTHILRNPSSLLAALPIFSLLSSRQSHTTLSVVFCGWPTKQSQQRLSNP